MAWGAKKGFWGQKITPSLFCEVGTPLTKICPKMAKIHVKRRKLLSRSASGKSPPTNLFCPKKPPKTLNYKVNP